MTNRQLRKNRKAILAATQSMIELNEELDDNSIGIAEARIKLASANTICRVVRTSVLYIKDDC